jgi:hypothetical protein
VRKAYWPLALDLDVDESTPACPEPSLLQPLRVFSSEPSEEKKGFSGMLEANGILPALGFSRKRWWCLLSNQGRRHCWALHCWALQPYVSEVVSEAQKGKRQVMSKRTVLEW